MFGSGFDVRGSEFGDAAGFERRTPNEELRTEREHELRSENLEA